MNIKVGDKILVHGTLETTVEEIINGVKIYFRDENGPRWYVDEESDFEIIGK